MRIRVRYTKLGKVRFVSHRDGARLWERALRKTQLPVATSVGFTPRMKISFGLALPVGAESLAEYLDVDLVDAVELDGLAGALSDALPEGFVVTAVTERDDASRTSLQEEVVACTWQLSAPNLDAATIVAAADRLLAAASLPLERERKGKRRVDDIRPAIESMSLLTEGPALVACLATDGRALRPAELAAVAFPDLEAVGVRVLRTHQWIEHEGTRREVLSLPHPYGAPVGAAEGTSS